MNTLRLPNFPIARLRNMDPRRSLVAGIIWLMIALAASFAAAASFWAGRAAREIVVQQHVRRLALETAPAVCTSLQHCFRTLRSGGRV